VIGLISGTVAAAARSLGHFISFGITGTLMIVVNVYVAYKTKSRPKKPIWKRFGPLVCTICAAFLIMADLLRHVLQDTNVWPEGPWPGSSQYRPDCHIENVTCLSPLGVLFTIVFTYSGFILLFIGTMWSANILQKLKNIKTQWQKLRARAKKAQK